jgi:hypothetical protein
VAARGEAWLKECPEPFWGRPGRTRPELEAHFRETEDATAPIAGHQPKSVFQIGGGGAVGTGSLRGMPQLLTLREGGYAVFPFDAPRLPLVLEIYPRTLTGPVKKSREDARAAYLDGRFPEMTAEQLEAATSSEDAFDAAVSAAIMARHLEEILGLEQPEGVARLEGAIWGVAPLPPARPSPEGRTKVGDRSTFPRATSPVDRTSFPRGASS